MWPRLSKQLSGYTKDEFNLIHKAYTTSEKSHEGQKRESGAPFISHPVAVATKLISLKLDAQSIAAALLHDVLEDTAHTKSDLVREFGKEIASLVDGLTKLDSIKYQGSDRKIESTRKMFLAVAQDIRVVLIKLADRWHNMTTINALRPDKKIRIATETLELYAPLAYRLGIGELKGELEDLAFPVVLPDEYQWLKEEVFEILPGRKHYLERISPLIKKALIDEGVEDFRLNFRTKHYFSLWKKLQKHDMDISKVTDLVALRILVHTPEDCYKALGIIHAKWKPVPGKIKDYIAMPKPNGYQSLHTTIFCEDNVIVEIQIRTEKMHEMAELGVAAHWYYEESGKPKEGALADPNKIAWVKQLQEWQRDFAEDESEEFMEALKIDFFKDRIFVLTPKGEVVDLPEGSSPIDFAYHIHSEVGDHMTGAKVNGKMVAFSHALASGDSVEIITQKNKTPSIDMLQMAHTAGARGHIRSALKKLGINLSKQERRKPKEKVVTLWFLCDHQRLGLLKEIRSFLTKSQVTILKADYDHGDSRKPYHTIECKIPSKCDLGKLSSKFRRIKGVKNLEIKS
jgi:GTP diphosphokinase / guanosine-3',5'-bis(diphosphate) 3'-diphosphatase